MEAISEMMKVEKSVLNLLLPIQKSLRDNTQNYASKRALSESLCYKPAFLKEKMSKYLMQED